VPVTTLFLVCGLVCSLYLGHLHLLVNSPGAGQVDSFCNINEAFNCVSVATSAYSSFLGLPIALWGIEFFALCLGIVLASAWGIWRIKRWDSLVFVLNAVGLIPCAILAWISAYKIYSFCIMCLMVYGMVLVVTVLLAATARWPIGELFTAGPREVLRWIGTGRGATVTLVGLGLAVSQLFWVPALLEPAADPGGEVEVKGLPTSGNTIGPADAPIRIEEFTDYQCPYCSQAHAVMMQVLKQFPGKIRLTHRDYPLDQACNPRIKKPFHPQACAAAIHARCAARQGKFWPYDRLLFHNRHLLDEQTLISLAAEAGVDTEKLKKCIASPVVRQVVVDDITEGIRRGVEGTPAFFINGEKVVGARKLEFWVEKITALLKQQ